jgi:hypothetical protein
MKRFILLTVCVFIIGNLYAQRLVLSGSLSWNPTISSTLISEAGNDYSGIVSSATNHSFLRIRGLTGSPWRVDVSKSDTNWNNGLVLMVQRTGNGIGGFGINGGTVAQTITNNNTPFFNGNNNISNIPIQFHLSGYSVLIPAGNYTSSVIFTLIDL